MSTWHAGNHFYTIDHWLPLHLGGERHCERTQCNVPGQGSNPDCLIWRLVQLKHEFLLYTCRYDVHEREVGELALEMGFDQVSLSSTIMPMVRIVPRGYTGKALSVLSSVMIPYLIFEMSRFPKIFCKDFTFCSLLYPVPVHDPNICRILDKTFDWYGLLLKFPNQGFFFAISNCYSFTSQKLWSGHIKKLVCKFMSDIKF